MSSPGPMVTVRAMPDDLKAAGSVPGTPARP